METPLVTKERVRRVVAACGLLAAGVVGSALATVHGPATASLRRPEYAASGELEGVLRRVAAQVHLALGVSEGLGETSGGVHGARARLLEDVGRSAARWLPESGVLTDDEEGVSPEVSGELYSAAAHLIEELGELPPGDVEHAQVIADLRVDLAERCLWIAEDRASEDEFATRELFEWRLAFLECATCLRDEDPDSLSARPARVIPLRSVDDLALVVDACARDLDEVGTSEHVERLAAVSLALLETRWLEDDLWSPGVVSGSTAEEVRAHVRRRQTVLERILRGAPGEAGFLSAAESLRKAAEVLAGPDGSDAARSAANLYELYELAAVTWTWGEVLTEGVAGAELRDTWSAVFGSWRTCTVRVLSADRFDLDRIDGDIPFAEIPDPLELPDGPALAVGDVEASTLTVEVLGPLGAVFRLRDAGALGLKGYLLIGDMDYRLEIAETDLVILAHCASGRDLDVPVPAHVQPEYTLFVNLPEQSDLAGPMGLLSPPWTEQFLAQQINETLGSRPIRADAERPLRDVLGELLGASRETLVDAKDRVQAIREGARADELARIDLAATRELQREFILRGSPVDAFPSSALVEWLIPMAADVLGWPDFVDGPSLLTNEVLGDGVETGEFFFRTVIWLSPRED